MKCVYVRVCVRVCVSAPCFLRISWAPVQKPWRAPRSCWKWPIKHSARLRRMASLRYTPTQNMADFQPWILTDNKNWSWGEMSEWSVYVTFIWNEKRENSFLFLFFLVFLILFLKWFYKFKYWLFWQSLEIKYSWFQIWSFLGRNFAWYLAISRMLLT